MKIKFNHVYLVYFMSNNMSFNIDEECVKLTKIVDKTFLYASNTTHELLYGQKINFLIEVLKLTMKYPQVELYLKDFLNYFTVNELEKMSVCKWTILHCMARYSYTISLNAFEIIINYGININIQDRVEERTAIHLLLITECTKHHNNILNLFMEHGANLNITNKWNSTVLDTLVYHHQVNKLSEETQNCIMTLIDFGTTTNYSHQDSEIYNFVEYYKSSTIKPAIKK